jgi:hypothetical protein
MSDQLKHNGNPEMQFEHQDLSPKGVYAFLVGLAVAGILVALFLWGLYDALDAREKRNQPAQNPLVQQTVADTRHVLPTDVEKFPQPRLEQNERLEINDFRLKEEQTLNSYGWADEKAGVVRIPIDRAMQLIAQRGLPTTPRAGTVPPAAVDLAPQTPKGEGLKK